MSISDDGHYLTVAASRQGRQPGRLPYFHHVSRLSQDDAAQTARSVWQETNGPNLRQIIQPTRSRARLVLTKGADHAIRAVALRQV